MRDLDALIAEIRAIYGEGPVPLHRPVFAGAERRFLVECVDSTFVSSVGPMVGEFEARVAAFTGARFTVATVNGTAALQVALQLAGVEPEQEVITQPLTFVATCNAVRYGGAWPVFVDVDRDTLGLSPTALRAFLERHAARRDDGSYNRTTGRRLAACLPVHSFGHPCRIAEIAAICAEYSIPVVEDAAESLGSWAGARHTGTFGRLGVLSFNGNKIITTGGGGMILTDDEALARRAKHLTTTAKVPHAWEFVHDEVGYNHRMPNLNAALGCAQIERLPEMLAAKRVVAERYASFGVRHGLELVRERAGTTANYWLNAVVLGSRAQRDAFLEASNAAGVMTRPVWRLMHRLEMFQDCQHDGLANAEWLEERVVNLPSSVPCPL
ncbi:MAG: LegC family aminotransferase [Pseudomonadota bacterium]